MAYNLVSLVLDLADGTGALIGQGSCKLAPSVQLTDASDSLLVIESPVWTDLSPVASPKISLLATDNANLLPSGWAWTISFPGVPGNPPGYSFFLPAAPQTFTATDASPAVFTGSGSGYLNNTGVQLSGGSLPAPFVSGTTYWTVNASGSAFELASAAGGTPIASTSTGSGSVIAVSSYLSSLTPVVLQGSLSPYLLVSGGTMTGPIALSGNPVSALQAAPKQYVDDHAGITDWLNVVTQYGADPTGAADSTTAINNAITAASAGTAGVVYFPAGTFKTNGGHVIPLNVSVIGDGKGITTFNHHGTGTYLFFIGSTTGGANPPNYMGRVGGFTISGQSGGNGTGPFGQQIGIKVLNCLFFNLQDIHGTLLYEYILIDGGDEGALGAGTFAGNGWVANCTSSNVYYSLHVYRWVTDTLYSMCYGYGNSPVTSGSVGAWFDTKPATSTMANLSYEGFDTGYLISTSQSGLCFLNPRAENCNTLVSYQGGTSGHTVVGSNAVPSWTASAAVVYGNPVAAANFAGLFTTYRKVSSAATPNATALTYGTPVTLSSEAGFSGLQPTALLFTSSGLATETVTIQTVTTYTDTTTNTVALTTTTTNTTVTISLSGMISLLGGSDGRIAQSVAFSVKSSINSSAASLTMTLVGLNLP